MNEKSYEAAAALVHKTYVDQGRDARRTHEKHIQILLQQVLHACCIVSHNLDKLFAFHFMNNFI